MFAGDLNYYNIEHDLRETAHLIDTARCPVYIMNGEYDPSTGFKEGEELAAKINGAVWIPMPGIGHFPMTEDYPTMKPGAGRNRRARARLTRDRRTGNAREQMTTR